jgi:glutaredoxin
VIQITLLTTTSCDLCAQATDVLNRLALEFDLEVATVDASSDQGRVTAERAGVAFPPGVLLNGEPFSYGRLSERKLRRALDKLGAQQRP